MKSFKVFMVVMMLFGFFSFCIVHAVCAAPIDDARALVTKAIDYVKANGKTKAYSEFTNNGTGQFKKGEMYIFVLEDNYQIVAHGANAKLIGKDLKGLKDSNNKYFFNEMVDRGLKDGEAIVDYMWTNPKTNKPGHKISYVKKLDDKTVIGCGIYEKNNGK